MEIKNLLKKWNEDLPDDIIDALKSHVIKQQDNDFYLRIMNTDETTELMEFMSDIEEFQNIIPLWTDDNSNYVGFYYQGPIKYRVCYVSHEETDLSPAFRSLHTFIAALEQNADLDWDELTKEYPTGSEANLQDIDADVQCIQELNQWLFSDQPNDDPRCQMMFSIMALTPANQLDTLIPFLDDEDMYVQERACEILGYHRYLPAYDKLVEVSQNGMPNGRMAAKKVLSNMRNRNGVKN